MNAALSPKTYIAKAEAALSGARLLLISGDMDGACSRAYYAMFDAAHAALFALRVEQISAPIKTHNGLVAQLGQHVVLAGHLADTHGEAINKVQRFRQLADYSGDLVKREDATGPWSRPRRSSPPCERVSCRRPTIVRLRYAIAHRQMAEVKIAFVRPPLSPGFPGLSVTHLDMSFDRFPAGGQCHLRLRRDLRRRLTDGFHRCRWNYTSYLCDQGFGRRPYEAQRRPSIVRT